MPTTPQQTTWRPCSPSYATLPAAESARSPVSPSPEKAQLGMLAKKLHVLRQREVEQAAEMDRLRRYTRPRRPSPYDLVCRLLGEQQAASGSTFQTPPKALGASASQEKTWIATLQTECQAQVHANRELETKLAAKDGLDCELRATASKQALTETTTWTLSNDLAAAQATTRSKESLLESLHTELEALHAKHDAVAANWKTTDDDATKQLASMTLRLKQAHAGPSASGQSILVKTLRDHVRLVQRRVEAQLKADKDTLLQSQLAESSRTIAEKDISIFTLNAKLEDRSRKHATLVHTSQLLEATVAPLTKEVATTQDDLAQLQQGLDHHLDVGFQELFRDEDALAAARAETKSLRAECARLERHVKLKAEWQQQVHELQTQVRANEQQLAASSEASLQTTHTAVVATFEALQASQVAAAVDLPRLTTQVHKQSTVIQRLEAQVAKRYSSKLRNNIYVFCILASSSARSSSGSNARRSSRRRKKTRPRKIGDLPIAMRKRYRTSATHVSLCPLAAP